MTSSSTHRGAGKATGKSRVTFGQALVLSLLLHGSLCIGAVYADRFLNEPQPRRQSNTLAFDLFGMISTRQAEARQPGPSEAPVLAEAPEEAKEPEKPAEPVTPPEPEPAPIVETTPQTPAPDQVLVKKKKKEKTKVRRPQTVASAPSDDAQVAQALRQRQSDERAMTRYLGGLRKAIQSRLKYPSAARRDAVTGNPVIRFTIMENGNILPGTLVIHRSSGYDILDWSALEAARASAPLPAPPREMQIVIAISFAESK